jgi:D-alanine-D-alanine ligase
MRLRVALLFGGRSGEHEVSLRSAASVAAALSAAHEVLPVFIDRSGRWSLRASVTGKSGASVFLVPEPGEGGRLRGLADAVELAQPDIYFPVLHGTYGEDGTVQGLLELAGVPYVGAGVAASAASMDKELAKAIFATAGVPQGPYRVLRQRDRVQEERVLAELGLPLFVKPANLGSSVGVTKVKEARGLGPALETALAYDLKAVVEKAIDGREIEVSVLGNDSPEASLPGEIVPDREFYDYDSKYSAESRTELLIPAPLAREGVAEAQALARAAFRAVDACGYARVDLFLEKGSGRLLVNEINTIPGFTSISMFPKLWEASGLPYPALLDRLLDLARERHARRSRLRTDHRPAPPGEV